MASVGGSIESVTLDGRTLSVVAEGGPSVKPGGFKNDIKLAGNGTASLIKMATPIEISGLQVLIDNANGDLDYLIGKQKSFRWLDTTITYADGKVHQGTTQIMDDLEYKSEDSTCSLTLKGPGELVFQ